MLILVQKLENYVQKLKIREIDFRFPLEKIILGNPVNLKELEDCKRGGIYAVAEKTKAGPFSIKIGRTINFKTRLNAYHLCWNQGFRVIALLPLIDRTPQADREKRTMILEKAAGELLGKSRTYPNRKARPSEWYFTTVSNVKII